MCALFNHTITNPDYIASSDWVAVNNELEGTWKEAVVALRYYSGILLEGTLGTRQSV
jgi:hypothetical protein